MAGIYIHIPFCRRLCGYCDFYKVMSLRYKSPLLEAISKELIQEKGFLQNEVISTIYFGGGTPSILSPAEIDSILGTIFSHFTLSKQLEITFEANPDDLTLDYLRGIKSLGINRLSIGIQSFDDKILKFMNRRHTADEAIKCVHLAKEVGFENLSLDIIYGVPLTDKFYLQRNLNQLCELSPQHISAYHLSVEEGTPFEFLRRKGKLTEISENNSEEQYKQLLEFLSSRGYKQYELSNFCIDGKISQHNSNYWNQLPYLGVGPSAHSYDRKTRRWNISNVRKYIDAIERNIPSFEMETLTLQDKINDYIMVKLRTIEGIDLNTINVLFGSRYLAHIIEIALRFSMDLHIEGDNIRIKSEAFLKSDYLIEKFFVT